MSGRLLCVGTHHKTGTVWLRRVLHDISRDQGIPILQVNRARKMSLIAETGPQIIVNWSSCFPIELYQREDARFLHVIRDPRDVLLSGARYHMVAPLGNEKFLLKTDESWEGRNYQEQLNALPDLQSRLLLEMELKHHKTVLEMLMWPQGHRHAITLRYEDLITDTDCRLFRSTLERLAVEGLDIDRAVQRFWDRALFGGQAKPEARSEWINNHVTSGTGGTAQWRSQLPRSVARIYAERYQMALQALGYAEDERWVELCPEDTAGANAGAAPQVSKTG